MEEIPNSFECLSRPSAVIPVSVNTYLTYTAAQQSFDKGDPVLMVLSTSGEINEYKILSVDENGVAFGHKLPYVEVCHAMLSNMIHRGTAS
jgi:hypothetical protein